MPLNSYFRRIAGRVNARTLAPPQQLFAAYPSVAAAAIAHNPPSNGTPLPVLPGKIQSNPPISKAQPQLPAAKMPAPKTTSVPGSSEVSGSQVSHFSSARRPTPPLPPLQHHAERDPLIDAHTERRQSTAESTSPSEALEPIQQTARKTAKRDDIPLSATSDSNPRRFTGAKPRPVTAQRPGTPEPDFSMSEHLQSIEHPPSTAQRRLEARTAARDRTAAPKLAEPSPVGTRVHIGSLEIRIMPPPPPSPAPVPLPALRPVAQSPKPISKEFPTYGLAQSY